MSATKKQKRASLRSVRENLYSNFTNSTICTYCGDTATEIDHVPAIKMARVHLLQGWRHFYRVPSCHECNQALGAKDIPRLDHRADYLLQVYEKRYKSAIKQPKWSDDDLALMGPHMKRYIKTWSAARDNIMTRVDWLKSAKKRLRWVYDH